MSTVKVAISFEGFLRARHCAKNITRGDLFNYQEKKKKKHRRKVVFVVIVIFSFLFLMKKTLK